MRQIILLTQSAPTRTYPDTRLPQRARMADDDELIGIAKDGTLSAGVVQRMGRILECASVIELMSSATRFSPGLVV